MDRHHLGLIGDDQVEARERDSPVSRPDRAAAQLGRSGHQPPARDIEDGTILDFSGLNMRTAGTADQAPR